MGAGQSIGRKLSKSEVEQHMRNLVEEGKVIPRNSENDKVELMKKNLTSLLESHRTGGREALEKEIKKIIPDE